MLSNQMKKHFFYTTVIRHIIFGLTFISGLTFLFLFLWGINIHVKLDFLLAIALVLLGFGFNQYLQIRKDNDEKDNKIIHSRRLIILQLQYTHSLFGNRLQEKNDICPIYLKDWAIYLECTNFELYEIQAITNWFQHLVNLTENANNYAKHQYEKNQYTDIGSLIKSSLDKELMGKIELILEKHREDII